MTDYTHTRRLATFLKMGDMGPSEFKRAIEVNIPRQLAYHDWDGKIVNARELLQTEGLAATNLIPTEVYATVIEGSDAVKCMRSAIRVQPMKSAVETVPYGATTGYAPVVAEGAEVPMGTETLAVATLTAKKIGTRPVISNEMISDAKYDAIAEEIRYAGQQVENTINRDCLDSFMAAGGGDAGTYQTDCGGSGATPIAFMGTAVGTLIGRGFTPTDIIFHPTVYGTFLGAMSSISTPLAGTITGTGKIASLYGCNTHLLGVSDTTATYVWGWGTNGYLGALVIDRAKFGVLGIREDVHVDRYPDSIRDMQSMNVLARFDSAQLLVTAGQYLQY